MPRVQGFDLYFLEASVPLTKTISPTGRVPYPMVSKFTSHKETVTTIRSYYDAVVKHAVKGRCMLKGALRRTLNDESRAGSTDSGGMTQHLMLDFDGLVLPRGLTTVDGILNRLGLGGVSYFYQYSASHGLKDRRGELNCHVAIILDEEMPAPTIKEWLMWQNLSQDWLREQAKLTKNGNAVKWALDITASQNDKLIYIAPPVFSGMKDPIGAKRWGFKEKKVSRARLDLTFSPRSVRTQHLALLNELRKAVGMEPRKKYNTAEVQGVAQALEHF